MLGKGPGSRSRRQRCRRIPQLGKFGLPSQLGARPDRPPAGSGRRAALCRSRRRTHQRRTGGFLSEREPRRGRRPADAGASTVSAAATSPTSPPAPRSRCRSSTAAASRATIARPAPSTTKRSPPTTARSTNALRKWPMRSRTAARSMRSCVDAHARAECGRGGL